MNLFRLSLRYSLDQPLRALLNTLLLGLAVAIMVMLLLLDHQMEDTLHRDAGNIDLVVGAQGSPLQVILSSLYHVDQPTGNIALSDARELIGHRGVDKAIPIALGDNYEGYRIVGTTHEYPEHYGATVAEGRLWGAPLEATIGAEVARRADLALGDEFAGVHGLSPDGHAHGDHPYTVVGVMERTGTVLDRLILSSVEGVWHVHGTEHEHDSKHDHDDANRLQEHGHEEHTEHGHAHAPDDQPHAGTGHDHRTTQPEAGEGAWSGNGSVAGFLERAERYEDPEALELTALLITYSSPLAAGVLPQMIDQDTPMQAASPAREAGRLMELIGAGADAVRAFAIILIGVAALSLFISLYSALNQRYYELAVMRMLGGRPNRLFRVTLLEGLWLAVPGTVFGLAAGHLAVSALGAWLEGAGRLSLTGFMFLPAELGVIALALAIGLVAALIPAWAAYRTEPSHVLARG